MNLVDGNAGMLVLTSVTGDPVPDYNALLAPFLGGASPGCGWVGAGGQRREERREERIGRRGRVGAGAAVHARRKGGGRKLGGSVAGRVGGRAIGPNRHGLGHPQGSQGMGAPGAGARRGLGWKRGLGEGVLVGLGHGARASRGKGADGDGDALGAGKGVDQGSS